MNRLKKILEERIGWIVDFYNTNVVGGKKINKKEFFYNIYRDISILIKCKIKEAYEEGKLMGKDLFKHKGK